MVSAKEIPPGGEGKIDVSFKAGGGKGGKKEKTITVTSNDSAQPTITLKVSTDVVVVLDLEPGRIPFGQIKKGLETVRYAALTGDDKDKTKITSVESNNQSIKVETNLGGFDNDKQKQVKVTVLPGMKTGRFNEKITLRTDHKEAKELPLYIMGEVLGNIAVTPNFINFGMLEKGKSAERVITLKATSDASFKVQEIKSTIPEIVTGLETIEAGKEYRVHVTLKENFTGEILRGQIVIKTSDKDQQNIEINAFGRAPVQTPKADIKKTP